MINIDLHFTEVEYNIIVDSRGLIIMKPNEGEKSIIVVTQFESYTVRAVS